MEVLEFYREAPTDIQEKIIVAMAEEQYSYWDYDKTTGVITVTCLNDLRLAPDCEEQCLGILIAVLSGLPKKLVVETSYTRNFSCFGQRFGSIEEETTDPDVKNWIRKLMPNDFCVEFVFNPYVVPSPVVEAEDFEFR
ncbi:hypothetical protein R1flu_005844 [Riccia fluitans]|uniref:Uncharacterized protein n=1 Tax=Riccia fluitans TaxID=41844 RepID=A0ABD1YUJ8_9MARC